MSATTQERHFSLFTLLSRVTAECGHAWQKNKRIRQHNSCVVLQTSRGFNARNRWAARAWNKVPERPLPWQPPTERRTNAVPRSIRQVLDDFRDQGERTGRLRVGDLVGEPEKARVEDGRAEQAQEQRSGDETTRDPRSTRVLAVHAPGGQDLAQLAGKCAEKMCGLVFFLPQLTGPVTNRVKLLYSCRL